MLSPDHPSAGRLSNKPRPEGRVVHVELSRAPFLTLSFAKSCSMPRPVTDRCAPAVVEDMDTYAHPHAPTEASMTAQPFDGAAQSANDDRAVPESLDRTLLESMVQMSLGLRLRGVDLESATGLSGRELDLVALLTSSGPTSVKSLVADLQLPRSTMTAIVDRLEERGLVLRHPNPTDRRSVILEATPQAAEALIRYRKGVMTLVEHIKRVLNEDEAQAFARSIQKIAQTL